MSGINVIEELHHYKRMYRLMQNAVIECTEICKDPIVKERLIKVQQEAEDIYTGAEYEYRKYTTPDELIIMLLLTYIKDRESSREVDLIDVDIIRDCVNWLLMLQNKKVEFTEEEIEERVKKFFLLAENKEKDSEQ